MIPVDNSYIIQILSLFMYLSMFYIIVFISLYHTILLVFYFLVMPLNIPISLIFSYLDKRNNHIIKVISIHWFLNVISDYMKLFMYTSNRQLMKVSYDCALPINVKYIFLCLNYCYG